MTWTQRNLFMCFSIYSATPTLPKKDAKEAALCKALVTRNEIKPVILHTICKLGPYFK